MSNKQTSVVILFQAKPGKEEELRQAMMELIPPVIAEPQCIGVNLHQDDDDPTKFMLYENWADKDYFTGEHMRTPHLQAYIDRSGDLLAAPFQIAYWNPLSENVGAYAKAQRKG